MSHLIGGGAELAWVAVKAALLYFTAVIGLRLSERRTLAEMSPFDFVAAIAVGAIIGRVPNSGATSYVAGAVTLVTVLVAHRLVARLRYIPAFARAVDHSPLLLVVHGKVRERALRRSGLTHADLYGLLRERGIADLSEARFVIFEQRGQISVVRQSDRHGEPDLVRDVAGWTSSDV